LTRSSLICKLQRARLLETKWRVQNLFHRKMCKLHDFSLRPQIMLFSCFSVKEVLVSSHLAPLSGPVLYYRIHYPDLLCQAYLFVLNDQDGANVPRLDLNASTVSSSGSVTMRRMDEIPFYCNQKQPNLRSAGLNARHSLVSMTLPFLIILLDTALSARKSRF
jgi:hypothetical protein